MVQRIFVVVLLAHIGSLGCSSDSAPSDLDPGEVCTDSNRNGICDSAELCPSPDGDADGDGVCDSEDTCADADDRQDFDGDGVANACDDCPFDNPDDSDSDGVCDFDDACPSFDDFADRDGDGIPDGCDACPDDAPNDSDGDGVCDSQDICAGGFDLLDIDNDGVPNACDLCPGEDDSLDGDSDGVADGCDACPADALGDSDGDGSCDSDDLCPGSDDRQDADLDGNPNACDPCPLDPLDDSDGDGSCDSVDLCAGFDDNSDSDGDSIPDGCDPCDDLDSDGVCDADDVCDGYDDNFDFDADSVPNGCDACPFDDPDDPDGDGICNGAGSIFVFEEAGNLPLDWRKHDRDALIFDANGDGRQDVLVVRASEADQLYIQTTPGVFTEPRNLVPFGVGDANHSLPSAIDLDQDGDIDVLFLFGDDVDCLGFYRNEGGVLTRENLGCFNLAGTTELLLSDLDCDGDLDLFAARGDNQVNTLLLQDTGTFSPAPTGVLPNHLESSMGVASADVDNDGDNDLLLASDNTQDRLYYNNCNNIAQPTAWTFTDAVYGIGGNFPLSNGNSRAVVVADLNSDGLSDVAMVRDPGPAQIYLNTGGGFADDNGLSFPQNEDNQRFVGIEAVDVDADGDLDLVANKQMASNAIWPFVYLNDRAQGGLGAFTASAGAIPDFQGEDTRSLVVGDLNSDGRPDIFAVNADEQDWLLINNGFGENLPAIEVSRVGIGIWVNNTFASIPEIRLNTPATVASDISGDFVSDLILGRSDSGASPEIWIGTGVGPLVHEPLRAPDAMCETQRILSLDLDEDGDNDLIMTCADGGARQLVNDGFGFFSDLSAANMFFVIGATEALATSDFDNDGDLDLLISGENGTHIWQNLGDALNNGGAFFLELSGALPANILAADAIFTDLNNDGTSDIMLAISGQDRLFHGDGQGGFSEVTSTHLPVTSQASQWVAAADLENDGDIDLVVGDASGVRLLLAEQAFQFTNASTTNLPTIEADVRTSFLGDVNNDGIEDIVLAVWGGPERLLIGTGTGQFVDHSHELPFNTDRTHSVVVADFDLNGRMDIITSTTEVSRMILNRTP